MKTFLLLAAISLVGCTSQQGAITSEVLTGICDVGFIALGAPGAVPICADINAIEQQIANRKTSTPGRGVLAPMTQTDLYMMVKASGQWRPARVE